MLYTSSCAYLQVQFISWTGVTRERVDGDVLLKRVVLIVYVRYRVFSETLCPLLRVEDLPFVLAFGRLKYQSNNSENSFSGSSRVLGIFDILANDCVIQVIRGLLRVRGRELASSTLRALWLDWSSLVMDVPSQYEILNTIDQFVSNYHAFSYLEYGLTMSCLPPTQR